MPKTIRNKYHEYLSFENLLSAHKKARRGKREKRQIIGVELALEQILFDLEKDLRERKYIHGEYNTFTIYDPKEREIKASHYKDRIVHQWYVENFIIPYFVPQFIETSYACITGRGMHKASSDVQDAMRKCSKKWNSSYYILKMDVSKYFQNIDKKALFEILKRKIKDKDILWLTKQILLSTEGRYGLPLGNYTSQMYANIYLNELDQYAKHILKCKDYYRYMDDVVIMCETQLKENEDKGIRTILQVFKDNPAKALYERLGFKVYNETETHYQMEKEWSKIS